MAQADALHEIMKFDAPALGPVSGVLTTTNKLAILAPYLALIGLVGAAIVAFATTRRRRA